MFSTILWLIWWITFLGLFLVLVAVRIDGRFGKTHKRFHYALMALALLPLLGLFYINGFNYSPVTPDETASIIVACFTMLLPALPIIFGLLARLGYRTFGHDKAALSE
jgi:hypothetical protein